MNPTPKSPTPPTTRPCPGEPILPLAPPPPASE